MVNHPGDPRRCDPDKGTHATVGTSLALHRHLRIPILPTVAVTGSFRFVNSSTSVPRTWDIGKTKPRWNQEYYGILPANEIKTKKINTRLVGVEKDHRKWIVDQKNL